MLLSCGAGEDSWESLGLQGDPTNQSEISRNQLRIFIGKTDVEAETPILWPSDTKIWLTGKDPDAGKDWRQEEKGMTEDEMVGWYHWLNGHEFEQAPGDCEGQGSLAFCSPWGCKELAMTEWLNNKNKFKIVSYSWSIVFFFYCVLTFFKWLLFDLKNLFCVTLKKLYSNLEKSV